LIKISFFIACDYASSLSALASPAPLNLSRISTICAASGRVRGYSVIMAEPVALIDTLNSLLDATLGSVFRLMDENSPYLSQATAQIRRPLAEMARAEQARARELAGAIERLGGTPSDGKPVRGREPYLEHLSLKFLLPKLVHEKTLQIQRYDNALRSVSMQNPEIGQMLEGHLRQMRDELAVLDRSATEVIASAREEQQG
jgi:hypothetical protein